MHHSVALACFFLSGVAGLVYEICWIRQASLVFGSTNVALTTVLATFFGGLAIGSDLFGRVAQRTARPLRLYALLEFGLAALALLSPVGFQLVDAAYGWAYRELGNSAWLAGARVGLVALLLLPPTVLMGGTFPLFCRQFVVSTSGIARSVGFLYGINTLGAALGCAATGLLLLPLIGVSGCIALAAACNVVAALSVLPLRLPALSPAPTAKEVRTRAPDQRGRRRTVGALFFATGLVAIGTQVLWARYLSLIVHNTVHTYTITLTVVLIGVVVGSFIAARLFDTRLRRVASFGTLQVLGGLFVLLLMELPPTFWRSLGNELAAYALLMLIPAALSGAVFPLAIRMVLSDPAAAGAQTGRMAALNTFGGIAGALVIGFVGLPSWGLQTSVRVITGASLLTGLAAWWFLGGEAAREGRGRGRPWTALATAAALASWLALPAVLGTRVPADFLGPRDRLVAWKEGATANLAVLRDEGVLELHINRWWQGSDQKNHQIMAAHVPMLTHPAPRSVLVVGAGTGQAPARFLMYDVERLDCVDIEPALFGFVGEHYDSAWMRHDAVTLIPEDGRHYVAHAEVSYDLISIEVGQLFRPGVASFYTVDFYERALRRLRAGGMLAQFVPLPFLEPAAFRGVLRTFLSVFPQSFLWYNHAELLLVGVKADRVAFDPDRLSLLDQDGPVREDLRFSQWGGPEHWLRKREMFLAGFLCGPSGLEALAGRALVDRDDVPVLEYRSARVETTARRELPLVERIEQHLEPVGAYLEAELEEEEVAAIESTRLWNLSDIEARAHSRLARLRRGQGDRDAARRLLEEARGCNPKSGNVLRLIGDLDREDGRFVLAEQLYTRALGERPDDALAHRGLGLLLLQCDRAEEAHEHLQRAVALRPNDAASHNYLGAALANLGKPAEATRELKRALELRPGYPSALRHLEQVRDALGGGR